MASVDLYGGDAQRIRSQYQTSLQRSASDDEVTGWLTGAYGGGGADDWLRQIAESDEARQRGTYKPPAPTKGPTSDQPPYQPPVIAPNPWESRPQSPAAVSPSGASAGAPKGMTAGGPPAQLPWDPATWQQQAQRINEAYKQYLGRDANDDEVSNWLMGKYGWGSGPGGVDAMLTGIRSSGEATAYQPPTKGPTSDAPPTGTNQPPPGGYQTYVQNLFNGKTPSPQVLESMAGELAKYGIKLGPRNARGFIDTIILPDGSAWDIIESATIDGGRRWQWIPAGGSSGGPGGPNVTTPGLPNVTVPGNQYSDPYTKLLEDLMSGRLNELLQPVQDPARQQYADAMQRRAAALTEAEPQYQQLMDFLQQRFTELQGPGYTGAENEVLRTQALDPIERDRAAARQRVTERLAARGLTMESGIAQQALNEVDQAFDAMRAQNQGQLAQNELMRREDRSQRATTIGGQLVDIPQARQREQLDVLDALQLLSSSVRGEEAARRREAIGYGGALADLGPQRLQLAMQAAGMGGDPGSAVSSLLGVNSLSNQNQFLNSQQSRSFWSGLGSLVPILQRAGI